MLSDICPTSTFSHPVLFYTFSVYTSSANTLTRYLYSFRRFHNIILLFLLLLSKPNHPIVSTVLHVRFFAKRGQCPTPLHPFEVESWLFQQSR